MALLAVGWPRSQGVKACKIYSCLNLCCQIAEVLSARHVAVMECCHHFVMKTRVLKLPVGAEHVKGYCMHNKEQNTRGLHGSTLHWAQLWPRDWPSTNAGWSEQLQAGVHLLLDETGEEAAPWLAILTGCAAPAQGHVVCADLCSQADAQAYQSHVYWHHPREPLPDKSVTAAQWVQTMAQRWPAWSHADWQTHCAGLGLVPHMDKPLWHLSTGSLRKLGLAAALASGARLTVIEEPTAALDSESIRNLCKALDALGEQLAESPQAPRWVVVAHWEPLPGVTWDEVLVAPVAVRA